jgi:hypothetical protein
MGHNLKVLATGIGLAEDVRYRYTVAKRLRNNDPIWRLFLLVWIYIVNNIYTSSVTKIHNV